MYESLGIQSEAGPALPLTCVHHSDSVPRAAFEKSAVGAFTCAELTAYAQVRVNFDSTGRIVVDILDPKHAGVHWAVLNARW